MYCQKCGAELREDAVFCEACGVKIEQKEQAKKVLATPKVIALVIAIIVIFAVVLLACLWGEKKKININDYMRISFEGYNTVGKASIDFDYYAFLEDYGEELKYKSNEVEKEIGLTPCRAVERYLEGELSKSESLTNGDEIHYYWTSLEQVMMPEFNYELVLETYATKVEGLSELREVNPFEDVEITFSGYAPYVRANILNQSNDKILSKLTYDLSKMSKIDNGDILTLRIYNTEQYSEEQIDKMFAEKYGIKLSSYEKEIIVEDCSEYVRTLEHMPEKLLEEKKAESEKVIYAMSSGWNDGVTIENVTYCGAYFFWCGSSTQNRIYLIYKVTVRENFPELGVNNQIDFYYQSKIVDAVSLNDGTYSLGSFDTATYRYFDRHITDKSWIRYRNAYETFQDLYDMELAKHVANYTYYTDVNIEE